MIHLFIIFTTKSSFPEAVLFGGPDLVCSRLGGIGNNNNNEMFLYF